MKGGEKGLKGLGIVVAATATAGTAAATPFLVKVGALLKKVNFKKLVEKVKGSKIKEALALVKRDSPEVPDEDMAVEPGAAGDGFMDEAEKKAYDAAQRQSGGSTNTPGQAGDKKDNTLLYVALAAGGLLIATKMF